MRTLLRIAAYTLLLYGSFAHNILCIPEMMDRCRGEFRTGYLGADSALVMNRLDRSANNPAGMTPLAVWSHETGTYLPYHSQYGLQGELFAAIFPFTGLAEPEFAFAAASGCAAFTALMLAAFFASLSRRIGVLASHIGVVLTASVPIMLSFATSLYWMMPVILAPFVAAWFLVPRCTTRMRFLGLLLLIAGLVCVKALCGYEYITTVILAPVAALTYHVSASREGVRSWLWKSAAMWAAGVIGFASAVGIHAQQIERNLGQDGLSVIKERATQRTGSSDLNDSVTYIIMAPDPTFLPEKARLPVRCFANYFWMPAVASPQTWGSVRFTLSLGFITLTCFGLAVIALQRRSSLLPEAFALLPAAAIAFAAAISWQALALNHMAVHAHLNGIVFCIPFLPFAFAVVGYAFQQLAVRCRIATVATALVGPLVLLAIGGNTIILSKRAATAEQEDRQAIERVEAVLRGEPATGPAVPYMPGRSMLFRAMPHGSLLGAESDPRLAPWARGSGRPCWFVPVSASAEKRKGGEPAVRVVAVQRGKVVPARVEYVRFNVIERSMNNAASWTGAIVAVEGEANDPPPRLFLVAEGQSVTEVKHLEK